MPNTHIEASIHSLLLTSWLLAFDRAAGTRFPVGDKPLTNRKPRFYRRSNQSTFGLSTDHYAAWTALVVHAHDLTVSPTFTLRGRERLAQTAGINVGVLDLLLRDLEFAGLILRTKRKGMQSNQIHLFLNPYNLGSEPDLTPQEIQCGDEPPYVPHNGKTVYDVSRTLDPETASLVEYLARIFPQNRCVQTPKLRHQLSKDLQRCIRRAGSATNVSKLLHTLLQDSSAESKQAAHAVSQAKNLGTYLNACMSDWMNVYGYAIEDQEVAKPSICIPSTPLPDPSSNHPQSDF